MAGIQVLTTFPYFIHSLAPTSPNTSHSDPVSPKSPKILHKVDQNTPNKLNTKNYDLNIHLTVPAVSNGTHKKCKSNCYCCVNSDEWFKSLKHAHSCPNELVDEGTDMQTNNSGSKSPPAFSISPFVPVGTVKRQVESININSKPLMEHAREQNIDVVEESKSNKEDEDEHDGGSLIHHSPVVNRGFDFYESQQLKQQRSPDSKRFKCEKGLEEVDSSENEDDDENNNRETEVSAEDQVVSEEKRAQEEEDEEEVLSLETSLVRTNQFYRSKKMFEELEDLNGVNHAMVVSKKKINEIDLVKKQTKINEIR